MKPNDSTDLKCTDVLPLPDNSSGTDSSRPTLQALPEGTLARTALEGAASRQSPRPPWATALNDTPSSTLILRMPFPPRQLITDTTPQDKVPPEPDVFDVDCINITSRPACRPSSIDALALQICRSGEGEFFEDGTESDFSRRLLAFVRQHAKAGIDALRYLLLHERASAEVTGEALRWLGLCRDAPTHRLRRTLLEDCLQCRSPVVRDGAVLGLAFLDDAHAISALKRARELEDIDSIKQGILLVLRQLHDSAAQEFREVG